MPLFELLNLLFDLLLDVLCRRGNLRPDIVGLFLPGHLRLVRLNLGVGALGSDGQEIIAAEREVAGNLAFVGWWFEMPCFDS